MREHGTTLHAGRDTCSVLAILPTPATGGPDGAVDNGDFDAFFVFFFQSCP